eukprot:1179088-Prorocentrum_minimum.AAC.4
MQRNTPALLRMVTDSLSTSTLKMKVKSVASELRIVFACTHTHTNTHTYALTHDTQKKPGVEPARRRAKPCCQMLSPDRGSRTPVGPSRPPLDPL